MSLEIVNFGLEHRRAAAQVLVDAFVERSPMSWPDLASGLKEVDECRELGPVRVAVDDGEVLGWVGLQHSFGAVWEVHPVAVAPQHQHRGCGRALMADIEAVAAARGAGTLQIGTGDEVDETSLFGIDLYQDPLGHLARIENRSGHPFGFYLRCGFAITGVIPDAEGPGKPDIIMCKRVERV